MAKTKKSRFGASAKPKKSKKSSGKKSGKKGNAWRAYTSGAPIPD
jgi:hypothetical protein